MSGLDFESVTPGAGLFHALLSGAPAGLLAYPLLDRAALVSAARAASVRSLDRAGLSGAVEQRLRALDAPAESLASARRLALPGSVVVVAGQQPGLFGGPHLVLSKALAAVSVARDLERQLSVPVVPVYWSAAEDHDHGEVDHVSVPAARGQAERLRVALPADRRALEAQPVPGAAGEVVSELLALLPEGPGRALVERAVQLQEGDTWADWTARALLRLLGRLGLVLVEPRTLRPFATEVLTFEIAHPGALHGDVERAEREIAAAGFAPALGLTHEELFFVLIDGRRQRVPFDGVCYHTEDGQAWSPADLAARVTRAPQDFSWNVVTRVLAQDAALPVAAQVCGPTELGYVAATRYAHERLGIPVPALVPRPGVTVVEPQAERAARALGVSPEDVVARGEAAFDEAPDDTDARVTTLIAAAAALPQSSDKGVARRREGVARAVELYAAALEREAATRSETAAGRQRRLLEALRPGGALQERSCTPLPWIARHGEGLLDRWLAAVGMPGSGHQLLRTAEEAHHG